MLNKLALSALVLGLSTVAAAAGDLRVINYTGYPIYYLYMSPSNSDDWGNDRLGSNQVLPHNGYIDLRGNSECWQDVLVEYENGVQASSGPSTPADTARSPSTDDLTPRDRPKLPRAVRFVLIHSALKFDAKAFTCYSHFTLRFSCRALEWQTKLWLSLPPFDWFYNLHSP